MDEKEEADRPREPLAAGMPLTMWNDRSKRAVLEWRGLTVRSS
mgnify:CR=1 FL=1